MLKLSYEYLERQRQTHPALKLLNADLQALIISFLYQVFIKTNRRTIAFSELVAELEDYLFVLRERFGIDKFPKKAVQYLNDWTQENTAYLRKYYVANSDEPECDLTPEVEKVFEWLQSLEQQEFVGTESRLLILFQLLRDVVYNTETNQEARIVALEKKKAEIEKELVLAKSGVMSAYDTREIKERFFQAEDLAKRLLSDFRQVEQNFRVLDRETREQIATSHKAKGEILDEIFLKQDTIRDSDQGKSFRAFWEFLMSLDRQDELENLLKHLYELEDIRALSPSEFLAHIQTALLRAGEKVYLTANALSEQLRRFLDNRAYLENKRLMEMIHQIERKVIENKNKFSQDKEFASIFEIKPTLKFLHSRMLFNVAQKIELNSKNISIGKTDIALDALYLAEYIDMEALRQNIHQALQTQTQISLPELLSQFPLEKGIPELVAYVKIASELPKTMVDENEKILIFVMSQGQEKQVRLPNIIFSR